MINVIWFRYFLKLHRVKTQRVIILGEYCNFLCRVFLKDLDSRMLKPLTRIDRDWVLFTNTNVY